MFGTSEFSSIVLAGGGIAADANCCGASALF